MSACDVPRQRLRLSRAESLRLLASVGMGRVVFTKAAMPAIRPVNHAVDGDRIIVRTHEGSALLDYARRDGAVVAYEADCIDAVTHLGWSVIVTGYARIMHDPADVAIHEVLLHPWVNEHMAHLVAIDATDVTGIRLAVPRSRRPC